MKRISLFVVIFCVGMLIMISGCGDKKNSITSTDSSENSQLQSTSTESGTTTTLSDDTSSSEINSSQYPEGTAVIAAIGDSITYGKGSSVGGYPTYLEKDLQAAGYTVEIINEGVSGERSSETDKRFLEVIASDDVDIVLIMIGTNDIIDPRSCSTPYDCQTVAYIESLIDKALISKTIPVVSLVTPARSDSIYSWANSEIQELNAEIAQLAAEKGVLTVNNYSAIISNGNTSLYSDKLHFTDAGYAVIASQWYDVITTNSLIETAQGE